MADDYRRVMPKPIVSGSGMTADPDRIENMQNENARLQRLWRPPPEQSFDQVMRGKQQDLARQRKPPTEEELAEIEAEKERKTKERKAIRALMGGGTVHPDHADRKRKVALKA